MNVSERALSPSEKTNRRRIEELKSVLADIQPQLVAAEQRLAEQLAEINRFEFLVRSRLERLSQRLEGLEQEINSLRRELRQLRDDSFFPDSIASGDLFRAWLSSEEAGSAASGEFRYHEAPAQPPEPGLSASQADELKQLFRRLARRFHPDFALNEEDRAYRTGIMMAVNAAYTAGDLARLEELSERPDPQKPEYSDQELADALLREVEHCRQRIAEIERELAGLYRHPSYLLKVRVDKAARAGQDLLDVLAGELRERVAERMVERDVLLSEIEAFRMGEAEFVDEAFADAVYNLGLEQALIEDRDGASAEWRDRHYGRLDLDDVDPEDGWEGLRRARRK